MAKKLFVGGLSWGMIDADLRKAFEPYGEITEAKVITDRDTGRSRGFGFVTSSQDEDARTAMSLNHTLVLSLLLRRELVPPVGAGEPP